MLDIHFLNAGRGDCIVLHYKNKGKSHFGVIDSNSKQLGKGNNNTLKKTLEDLSVDKLSFIALTHPHDDHYSGLYEILSNYALEDFFSYPVLKHLTSKEKLSKLKNFYIEKFTRSSKQSRASTTELLKILDYSFKNLLKNDRWTCAEGPMNTIVPKGFDGVEISIIAPLPGAKASYLQVIQDDNVRLDRMTNDTENDVSLAFSIIYKGKQIILGGDTTYSKNWQPLKRRIDNGRAAEINGVVVKLPHHGSAHDSNEDVIDLLFAKDGERHAIISANGTQNPSSETLKILERKGIKPHCTNLSSLCKSRLPKDNITKLMPGLDPVFARSIYENIEKEVTPCQGSIKVSVNSSGNISINSEYSHLCPYRDVII